MNNKNDRNTIMMSFRANLLIYTKDGEKLSMIAIIKVVGLPIDPAINKGRQISAVPVIT